YSGNLVAVAETWTPENLDGFLADPKGWAPGTKMGYAGMKSVEDRANLIAWLDSLDG
ncbi:MAG: cytochrome c family protein, partial [Boseongicola sp.]|nr:cytochrome c family protein [Boseongicola sp.]